MVDVHAVANILGIQVHDLLVFERMDPPPKTVIALVVIFPSVLPDEVKAVDLMKSFQDLGVATILVLMGMLQPVR